MSFVTIFLAADPKTGEIVEVAPHTSATEAFQFFRAGFTEGRKQILVARVSESIAFEVAKGPERVSIPKRRS